MLSDSRFFYCCCAACRLLLSCEKLEARNCPPPLPPPNYTHLRQRIFPFCNVPPPCLAVVALPCPTNPAQNCRPCGVHTPCSSALNCQPALPCPTRPPVPVQPHHALSCELIRTSPSGAAMCGLMQFSLEW